MPASPSRTPQRRPLAVPLAKTRCHTPELFEDLLPNERAANCLASLLILANCKQLDQANEPSNGWPA
jgi:hypothetical protein